MVLALARSLPSFARILRPPFVRSGLPSDLCLNVHHPPPLLHDKYPQNFALPVQ